MNFHFGGPPPGTIEELGCRVEEARQLVAEQEARVLALAAKGHPTESGRSLLEAMRESLAQFERALARIEAEPRLNFTGGEHPCLNRLLVRLPSKIRLELQRRCEAVSLRRGVQLEQAGRRLEHVILPECGVLSVSAAGSAGGRIEIALIGREGASGIPALLADGVSAYECSVLVDGFGLRISAVHLREFLEEHSQVRSLFGRYSAALFAQLAFGSLGAGAATLEQRVARWILMNHDRTDGDELHFSHQELAAALGVRRPSVTLALHMLSYCRLVRSRRMRLIILDRAGLEASAGGIYGPAEAEYRRLLGD